MSPFIKHSIFGNNRDPCPGARRMERRGRGKRTLRPSGKASSVAGFKNCSSDITKWSCSVLSAHRYRGKGKRQECHSEVTRTTPEYWSCTLVTLHWSYRSASGRSSGSYDSREWRFCRQNRMREVRESLVLERWGELAVVRRMIKEDAQKRKLQQAMKAGLLV